MAKAPRTQVKGARKAGGAAPTVPPPDVETFLGKLQHPLKREILLIREMIAGAAAGIGEEIKWNAPSFRTSEHFATLHLRASDRVQVVLHCGAKPRSDKGLRKVIADPEGLLDWRDPHRAIVTFRDLEDVQAKRGPFTTIVRKWIEYV